MPVLNFHRKNKIKEPHGGVQSLAGVLPVFVFCFLFFLLALTEGMMDATRSHGD